MKGNIQYNLDFLKVLLEKYPETRFVFFRRYGGNFAGDFVDIPIKQAITTINQNPDWEIIVDEKQKENKKISQFAEENLPEVPPIPSPISEREFNKVMGIKAIEKRPRIKPRKFVYVKNSFGKIIDIPIEDLAATLKQPGMKLVSEEVLDKKIEAPVIDKNPLECPICGFVAKTKSGLIIHSKKHKK